jgi:hypothetical protein
MCPNTTTMEDPPSQAGRIPNRTLNTAEPTMVPKPTADSVKQPMNDVKSSGADPPAAMNVAPATSSSISHRSTSAWCVSVVNPESEFSRLAGWSLGWEGGGHSEHGAA